MSLSSSDRYTPGSLPSWPLLDFNTPLSCLLQEDLQHPPSFMGSKSAPQSPSLSPSPLLNSPPLLSSPASMGASTAKVTKRKSRAANKPPIRVLSADRASFRDVVQKLTGIPTSPSTQARQRLWGAGNLSGISRPGSHNDLMAAAHQSMPTLDTSFLYLSRGYSSNNMVYDEVGKSRFNSPYEANFDSSVQPGLSFDRNGRMGSFDPNGGVILPGQYIEGGMGMAMDMDMESLRRLHQAPAELQRQALLMGSNKLENVLQRNKIDTGFPLILLRTPSPPKVEAHSL